MKSTTIRPGARVRTDGTGIVSHAGAALLRELADQSGLTRGWTEALLSTYKGLPIHPPGRVLTDLAVTLADGGDCLADLAALRDQAGLFGVVASHPTAYRVLDRVGTSQLDALRTARAAARASVWAAGGGPDLVDEHGNRQGLVLDVDTSLLTAHSEKEGAAPIYKRGFGFHPLLVFLDRPDVSGGEALAAILRPGNAGSNSAADHLTVLDLALAQLPEHARPTPGVAQGPEVLIRSDSAGATHAFLTGCRERTVRFSVGLPVDQRIQDAILLVPDEVWVPAIRADGQDRPNGEVVELTKLLDLSTWPAGSRVICRRERPHPGAQYAFTDIDGHRFQVFLTDTPRCGNDVPRLELRQRQHARVEDRIRNLKDRGMRNLPARTGTPTPPGSSSHSQPTTYPSGARRCFSGQLRRVEPKRFRYRVLHLATRISTTGRRVILRLDQHWPWATDLANAFNRLRAAPWPG